MGGDNGSDDADDNDDDNDKQVKGVFEEEGSIWSMIVSSLSSLNHKESWKLGSI